MSDEKEREQETAGELLRDAYDLAPKPEKPTAPYLGEVERVEPGKTRHVLWATVKYSLRLASAVDIDDDLIDDRHPLEIQLGKKLKAGHRCARRRGEEIANLSRSPVDVEVEWDRADEMPDWDELKEVKFRIEADRDAHYDLVKEPQDVAALQGAAPDLLKACEQQHTALDILMAMLIQRDPDFLPSKCGQPWAAVVLGNEAITKAEGDALMSYSRWTNSRWYTYWTCVDGGAKTMDGQTFDVDCIVEATYGEMAQDFKGTLDRLVADVDSDAGKPTTAAEREELAGYMRAFMAEVVNEDLAGRDWTETNSQRMQPKK